MVLSMLPYEQHLQQERKPPAVTLSHPNNARADRLQGGVGLRRTQVWIYYKLLMRWKLESI